jgi:hypothetical protein
MIVHDFACSDCHHIEKDILVSADTLELPCPACEQGVMEVYYGGWETLGFMNQGRSVDDREAADGTITMMGARDSKLCRIELGLEGGAANKTLRTFTPEQSSEFRKRILLEGEGARTGRKLFEDIIKTRKENQAKK